MMGRAYRERVTDAVAQRPSKIMADAWDAQLPNDNLPYRAFPPRVADTGRWNIPILDSTEHCHHRDFLPECS